MTRCSSGARSATAGRTIPWRQGRPRILPPFARPRAPRSKPASCRSRTRASHEWALPRASCGVARPGRRAGRLPGGAGLLPELAARALGPLSVRELLAHTSGLAAWEPLFLAAMADPVAREIFGPARVRSGVGFARARQVVLERAWAAAPGPDRGRRVYSDLGFIALGRLVERSAGTSLDRFCREAVFAPLGLADLGFVDLATDERQWISGRHVLPTGRTRPREPAPGQERDYAVRARRPFRHGARAGAPGLAALGGNRRGRAAGRRSDPRGAVPARPGGQGPGAGPGLRSPRPGAVAHGAAPRPARPARRGRALGLYRVLAVG
ncbi:MAG: beta-lactamase family protein [Deltaproteobacteria bacterium]|nr:beta-lactamase family protein [Deltaproteobacteria bacterium]